MGLDVFDWRAHSRFSDPGGHGHLLDAVEPEPAAIGAVCRNVIVHYRASRAKLPAGSRADIDARWLSRILDLDQSRHPVPLRTPRAEPARVQGCCRDHALLGTAVLRQHGIPARSRVGFAGYFAPGYHVDHVIVEFRDAGRWRRFEPELDGPLGGLVDPLDVPAGPSAPFATAAEVWRDYRAGRVDPDTDGVFPGSPVGGPWFMHNYVLLEVAARYGEELLLWDSWGAVQGPEPVLSEPVVARADRLAALLIRADAGDRGVERELLDWYRSDPCLHPGSRVLRLSPLGEAPGEQSLDRPGGLSPARSQPPGVAQQICGAAAPD